MQAAACDYYERALKQLPLMHAARNNLIRGLMKRGSPADLKAAIDHARLSAELQADQPEMHYQYGVVLMQQAFWSDAAAAYEVRAETEGTPGAISSGTHPPYPPPPSSTPVGLRNASNSTPATAALSSTACTRCSSCRRRTRQRAAASIRWRRSGSLRACGSTRCSAARIASMACSRSRGMIVSVSPVSKRFLAPPIASR